MKIKTLLFSSGVGMEKVKTDCFFRIVPTFEDLVIVLTIAPISVFVVFSKGNLVPALDVYMKEQILRQRK